VCKVFIYKYTFSIFKYTLAIYAHTPTHFSIYYGHLKGVTKKNTQTGMIKQVCKRREITIEKAPFKVGFPHTRRDTSLLSVSHTQSVVSVGTRERLYNKRAFHISYYLMCVWNRQQTCITTSVWETYLERSFLYRNLSSFAYLFYHSSLCVFFSNSF
jgi:hypothetical protein